MSTIEKIVSCLDDYDPNALRVDKACEAIRSCLSVPRENEIVPLREALGRVLDEPIVPSINVPAHDNSAMDGYALRLSESNAYLEVGTALAGRPFAGKVGPGQCVRVMSTLPRSFSTG